MELNGKSFLPFCALLRPSKRWTFSFSITAALVERDIARSHLEWHLNYCNIHLCYRRDNVALAKCFCVQKNSKKNCENDALFRDALATRFGTSIAKIHQNIYYIITLYYTYIVLYILYCTSRMHPCTSVITIAPHRPKINRINAIVSRAIAPRWQLQSLLIRCFSRCFSRSLFVALVVIDDSECFVNVKRKRMPTWNHHPGNGAPADTV